MFKVQKTVGRSCELACNGEAGFGIYFMVEYGDNVCTYCTLKDRNMEYNVLREGFVFV